MEPATRRGSMDVGEIERRFGLRVRAHRIGEMTLRVSEVERVDEMVREVYPDAVTEHGDAPVWMITWPAALALAEHLVHEEHVRGLRVLELGCGTAAPGIAACLAGADVVISDHDPLALEVARRNVELSGCERIDVALLDWYRPALEGRFDLVVGSEVVYFEKLFVPLLAVLAAYVRPGGGILLSDQGRPQVEAFRRMCVRAGFGVDETTRTVHLEDRSRPIRIMRLRPGP